jgi:predicted AAA+ superfamily ATPase
MKGYITRLKETVIKENLLDFPAVAILGPRQCGKTTLANKLVKEISGSIYLDLERPADLRKLQDPELFFQMNRGKLVCLDEIQRIPELYPVLRGIIDQENKNSQFLILGSASLDLIQQSSETLAGRIAYTELSPFSFVELKKDKSTITDLLEQQWIRGGFPRSFLARSAKSSMVWRENFIRTFLERDIPQFGFKIAANSIDRLWRMVAHVHGQIVNSSQLGESLGVSHTTVRSYLDILTQTFMIRLLPPYFSNLKKRLVKSPKIYIRDSGILHALLEIQDVDSLLGHPSYGASWEGYALENIIEKFADWQPYFYRTSAGAELDLVLTKGQRKIGVEFKASVAPKLSKGFWNSIEDLNIDQAWVIGLVDSTYPIHEKVNVTSLDCFLELDL